MIREFNGQPVKDSAQFKLQVAETAPGTKLPVLVIRDGENKTFDVTLNDQPGQTVAKSDRANSDKDNSREALAGVAVADLTSNVRSQASIPDNVRGAIITEVQPGSAAAEAGLREGDVIVELNRKAVKSAQDAVEMTARPTGNQTLVKVWTRNGVRFMTVDENNVG